MEIINYAQWANNFVKYVLKRAKLIFSKIEIEELEQDKKICLKVDGKSYVIRFELSPKIKRNPYKYVPIKVYQYSFREIVDGEDGKECEKEINYGLFRVEQPKVEEL